MSEVKTEILGSTMPKDEIQEKINEMAVVSTNIKSGLESFKQRKEELQELAKEADGLEITSIEDKESIERVSTVRKKLKKERVEIEKQAKALRDPLTKFNKFISAKEDELLLIIVPIETSLQSKEDWVQSEYDRLAKEQEEARQKKFKDRLAALKEFGFEIEEDKRDYVAALSDEAFKGMLDHAKTMHEKDQANKKKLEDEQKAKDEQDRKDKEELEKLRLEKEKFLASRTKGRIGQLISIGFESGNVVYYFNHPFDDEEYIQVHFDKVGTADEEDWESLMSDIQKTLAEWKQEVAERKEKENQAAIRAKMIEVRMVQLKDLGMIYSFSSLNFEFDGIIITKSEIVNSDDAEWKVILQNTSDKIEVTKAELKQAKEKELELEKEKERQKTAGKERYTLLDSIGIKGQLPSVLGSLSDQDWTELWKSELKLHQVRQEKEKKEKEQEELEQSSDAKKMQNIVDQLRFVVFPEMKTKKAQKLAAELQDRINNLATEFEGSIAASKSTKAA